MPNSSARQFRETESKEDLAHLLEKYMHLSIRRRRRHCRNLYNAFLTRTKNDKIEGIDDIKCAQELATALDDTNNWCEHVRNIVESLRP